MKFFKKKSQTIDFTKMSQPQIPNRKFDVSNEGTVDLRNQQMPQEPVSENVKTESSGGIFDFLSSNKSSQTSYPSENPLTQVSEMSEIKQSMKSFTNRLENLDNELYRLLHKMELIEQKLQRFENRGL